MIRQKSFQSTNAKLYLVATPIGNLDDITLRAINILKEYGVEVDVRCLSAHRAHKGLSDFIKETNENGTEVIIAGAKNGYKINSEGELLYIDSYENSTIYILKRLSELSSIKNGGQKEYNQKYLKSSASPCMMATVSAPAFFLKVAP